MSLQINWNDAWDSVPFEYAEEVIEYFEYKLQPSHPLRKYKLFPVAKFDGKNKYLIEEKEPSDRLWLLDFEQKKRVKGKTCYYFKEFKNQDEVDFMMNEAKEEWIQYMKDNGAWFVD